MIEGNDSSDEPDQIASPQKRLWISFYPSDDYVFSDSRKAAEERAAVLFDSAGVCDSLGPFYGDSNDGGFLRAPLKPAAFELVPSEFLRRARKMQPRNPEPTASAFSQWTYSIYGNAFGRDEDRERGKVMEQRVLDMRATASSCNDNNFLKRVGSDWMLIHNGVTPPRGDDHRISEISQLSINGSPLRVCPDLIYRNVKKSQVIIVEIKHSRLSIPTNLWPNVWAQLWCYAQLEVARSAQSVTVVGEVWGERWGRVMHRVYGGYSRTPLLCLRASVRRDPRAPGYDRFFRKLFDIYRGEC